MCGILAVLGCVDHSQAKRARIIELSRRSYFPKHISVFLLFHSFLRKMGYIYTTNHWYLHFMQQKICYIFFWFLVFYLVALEGFLMLSYLNIFCFLILFFPWCQRSFSLMLSIGLICSDLHTDMKIVGYDIEVLIGVGCIAMRIVTLLINGLLLLTLLQGINLSTTKTKLFPSLYVSLFVHS